MKKKIDKKELLEKSHGTFNEFKEFISKGNVIDLAVGVIIGSAFGKIVTSIVNDILMPLIGIVVGGLDFTNLSVTVKDANIKYGMFIQNVIDFLIVAFCIFIFVKVISSFTRKKEEEEEEKQEEVRREEVVLLEEIRDLLKENKSVSKKK